MKEKAIYIIGGALIIAFVTMGVVTMMQSQMPYFETIQQVASAPKGSSLQFIAPIVPGKTRYSQSGGELFFEMKDKNGEAVPVRYRGIKPDGFDTVPKVIVQGTYDGKELIAQRVQTTCPSKYQEK